MAESTEGRPVKPDGHDYHRCKCDACGLVRRWMRRRYYQQRVARQHTCAVDGCAKKASGGSLYCGAHHSQRYERDGISGVTTRTNDGTARTYSRAHGHLRDVRGPASRFQCVDCGGSATDWSLKHESTERLWQLTGTHRRMAFSPNVEDYDPRCKSCHTRYDSEARHGQSGASAA